MTLTNDAVFDLSGKTAGLTNNVWTYYGNVEYSLNEHFEVKNESDSEKISEIINDNSTILVDPEDYAVVLLEKVQWDNSEGDKTLNRNLVLYIYCPHYSEPNLEEQKYTDVYNTIKRGEL